ncbi:hypothetical protein ACFE04_010334 [Oxalis oulophora]
MGSSKKSQADKKSAAAGASSCSSLKPINTKPRGGKTSNENEENSWPTTPTGSDARIPEKLAYPAPPRKRRPPLRCNHNGVREFFVPPDLETVFKCCVREFN